MRELIKGVPIPTAGLALGLAALGNLLSSQAGIARPVCGILSAALIALVISKVILFPSMIREDFKNPILASVSATLLMALMQIAGYVAPHAFPIAFMLWTGAVIAHLALMVWFSARYFHPFKLDQVFPTYFICYVGIIVASVTSPLFGMEAVGRVLFWIGFACYPVLLGLITYRYAKHPVPDAARPLFCIYSAPASLSLAGYLAVTEEPNIVFVSVLLVVAQLMFAGVLTKVGAFIRGGFYPSYAAMTFPFVITATALSLGLEAFAAAGMAAPAFLYGLCTLETIFATGMVAFVFMRYAIFLAKPLTATLSVRPALTEE